MVEVTIKISNERTFLKKIPRKMCCYQKNNLQGNPVSYVSLAKRKCFLRHKKLGKSCTSQDVSRILIQIPLFFFAIPYFGRQGQYLGMKRPDNLRKRIAFVTVVQRSAVSPLVESKPGLIKHLAVLHQDVFWAYPFLKLMSGWCSNTLPPLRPI